MWLRTQSRKALQLWGQLPTKAKYAVVAAVAIFIGTIVRLNIENWATEIGIHRLYTLRSPEWLMSLWSIVFGQFGIGLVLGALLFAFLDPTTRWFVGQDARTALHTLRKEGVRCRNELLLSVEVLDYAQERARMIEWSDRTVQAMKDAKVPLKLWSRFDVLNKYEPKSIGSADRPASQVKLETMWNRKLELIEEAIDHIGA